MITVADATEQWLLQFESGRKWKAKLPSAETRKSYFFNFKRYCDAVGKNPDELKKLKKTPLEFAVMLTNGTSPDTIKENEAEDLLESFFATCTLDESVKEITKTSVKSFYKHNQRELESWVASNITKTQSKMRKPTMQEIQELDNAMTCQRDKALLWFIESTAVRDGCLPKLRWSDLKPTEDPEIPYQMEIENKRLKGQGQGKYAQLKPQICFLHSLAAQKLEAYRRETERKGYKLAPDSPIFIAYKMGQHKAKHDRKAEFFKIEPLKQQTMTSIFNNASLVAWGDLEVKRFSPQDFREFFESELEECNINQNLIDRLMAHTIKGTNKHYSSHESTELMEKFRLALSRLVPESLEEVKAETKAIKTETERKLKNQQSQIEALQEQVKQLMVTDREYMMQHYPLTIERSLTDPKTEKTETWVETWHSPEEENELSQRYMEKRRKLGIPDRGE